MSGSVLQRHTEAQRFIVSQLKGKEQICSRALLYFWCFILSEGSIKETTHILQHLTSFVYFAV